MLRDRMRPRLVIVPAVVAAAFGAGCSLITSYDGFTGNGGGADATVVDAGPTTEQTLCAPEIPGKPTTTSAGLGVSSLPHYGVVNQLRFVPADGGCPQLGKDLDGLDSCGDAGDTKLACAPVDTDAGTCDFNGGVDNIASTYLLEFATAEGVNLASQIPVDLAVQRTGFLLEITGWAGEANNAQVGVAYFPDIGVAVDGGVDGGTMIDESSVSSIGLAYYQATTAWVTNGVLVANFTQDEHGDAGVVPLHFHAFLNNNPDTPASLNIPIAYATIIGVPKIDPVTGGITMTDAQLVGRLRVPDFVTSLTALYGCLNSGSAALVCPLTDLPSAPSADGTGASCDALSLAVGFDLVPSTRAGAGPAIPSTDLCKPGQVPANPDICGPASTAPPVGPGDDDDASMPDAGDDDAAL